MLFISINQLSKQIIPSFAPVDSKAAVPDTFFLADKVIRMELHADFSAIQKDRDQDPQVHTGELIYYTPSGENVKLSVNVTTRGNFRLDPANCKFPPLMIDFKKSQVRNMLFDNQNKLKIFSRLLSTWQLKNSSICAKPGRIITCLKDRA